MAAANTAGDAQPPAEGSATASSFHTKASLGDDVAERASRSVLTPGLDPSRGGNFSSLRPEGQAVDNSASADGYSQDPPPGAGSAFESRPLDLAEKKQQERPEQGHDRIAAASIAAREKGVGQEFEPNSECKMYKFSLYETASRFFLVGGDVLDQRFRILKVDKTEEVDALFITEDETVYTKEEMTELLDTIDDGNKSSGGLKFRCSTWGLLGFIRFTGEYYMLLITKRSQVALLGGHYIYQIDNTELISLSNASPPRSKVDRQGQEARYLAILNNLDLTRYFYFSYSYDVTNTLQRNIQHEREALRRGVPAPSEPAFNDMFIWNHHLLAPPSKILRNVYDWCLPIIHGFVDQASMGVPREHLRTCTPAYNASSVVRLRSHGLHNTYRSPFEVLRWRQILEKGSQ
jgi:phosphatidylinositol 3,5-bisphosphate 5-phosphatase